MTWPRRVLLFLLGAAVLQTLHYYPLLPPVVASHFGASGRPNGWSTRDAFLGIYWGCLLLMVFLFHAFPVLLRHVPASLINLPHRDYWLAPERREASLAALQDCLEWFGNAVIAFLLLTFEAAIEANLPGGEFANNRMWGLLACFLLFSIWWTVKMYRRFPNPRRSESPR